MGTITGDVPSKERNGKGREGNSAVNSRRKRWAEKRGGGGTGEEKKDPKQEKL